MANGGQSLRDAAANGRALRPLLGGLDLLACCGLVALAGLAYAALPGGSALRMSLAFLVLFFAPGYLLIEASAGPARTAASRALRALAAVGVSPPLVGLLALGTALLPGGFRPLPILTILLVACFALAAAAFWRRKAPARQASPEPTTA